MNHQLLLIALLRLCGSAAAASAQQQQEHNDRDPVSSSTSSSNNRSDGSTIPTFGQSDEDRASDYADYFSAYADLHHQKVMLTDHNRMRAYHDAIMDNKDVFKDKVVMDVGTGSSVLAVWAAKAGAKRVYAVEYTVMAEHAKAVVKANGVDDVVKVIRGAVEDVTLPLPDENWGLFCDDGAEECRGDQRVVDIIISEWMGYFLIRESMHDTVILARDKFLKPTTGLMFPSHATMLFAPIGIEDYREEVTHNYANAMTEWKEYLGKAQKDYGVDMAVLDGAFEKEQREYYLESGHWLQLKADDVLSRPVVVKEFDMATCTLEEAKGVLDPVKFGFDVSKNTGTEGEQFVSGFAGWFTVDFRSRTDAVGKAHAPEVKHPAHLSTGPEAGVTHWGQQVFYLPNTIPLSEYVTVRLEGSMKMVRSKEAARLYDVHVYMNESSENPVELKYKIV